MTFADANIPNQFFCKVCTWCHPLPPLNHCQHAIWVKAYNLPDFSASDFPVVLFTHRWNALLYLNVALQKKTVETYHSAVRQKHLICLLFLLCTTFAEFNLGMRLESTPRLPMVGGARPAPSPEIFKNMLSCLLPQQVTIILPPPPGSSATTSYNHFGPP